MSEHIDIDVAKAHAQHLKGCLQPCAENRFREYLDEAGGQKNQYSSAVYHMRKMLEPELSTNNDTLAEGMFFDFLTRDSFFSYDAVFKSLSISVNIYNQKQNQRFLDFVKENKAKTQGKSKKKSLTNTYMESYLLAIKADMEYMYPAPKTHPVVIDAEKILVEAKRQHTLMKPGVSLNDYFCSKYQIFEDFEQKVRSELQEIVSKHNFPHQTAQIRHHIETLIASASYPYDWNEEYLQKANLSAQAMMHTFRIQKPHQQFSKTGPKI